MRRHLTYANVMSTLGVFLALAGGFAIAKITGDGSLRSGQVTNLTPQDKTVVTVPGMGRVTAHCENDTTTRVGWKHTSERKEHVSVEFDDATTSFVSQPGSHHEYTITNAQLKLTFHVFRHNGDDEPQTTVDVVADGIFGADCAERVAAIATSTTR